jgi:hypothetical protein
MFVAPAESDGFMASVLGQMKGAGASSPAVRLGAGRSDPIEFPTRSGGWVANRQ